MNSARLGICVSGSKKAGARAGFECLRWVMSRDTPKVPTIRPACRARGILVVENPTDGAVGHGLLLLHVHQRQAGADDLLLVPEGLRGVLVREVVEVAPADGLVGIGKPMFSASSG